MTTMLEQITTGLGADAEKYSQAAIERVLRAERAAQASWVRHEGERPAELDDALLARVRYNLEQTGGAEPVQRIGIQADGVRELEFPFSPRGRAQAAAAEAAEAAEADEAAAAARRQRTKAAKKTTAKKAARQASPN